MRQTGPPVVNLGVGWTVTIRGNHPSKDANDSKSTEQ